MQVQIQALLAGGEGTAGNIEVAKPQLFDRTPSRVAEFITGCKLYIKNKLAGATVEAQVQWVLSYVQEGSADVWKENVIEELETGEIEYEMVEEFLSSLKKEFGGGEEKLVKAVELRKLEQGGRTMEEFVQEFKRAARGSRYEGRPLVEEFKRGMNGVIRRRLMESENQPGSIKQWYKRAMALDRNWRESKRKEKRLRGKKETGRGAPKQEQQQNRPRSLVWQRRQMPSQQATTGPAPMEGVVRTNAVVVRGSGQGTGVPLRWDPYAMEVDQGRNCYTCRGFRHMACHCRNRDRRRAMEERKVEYGGERIEKIHDHANNLKGVESLELLD